MSLVQAIKPGGHDESLRLDDYEPKHLGFLLERVVKHSRHELYAVAAEMGFDGRYEPLTPGCFRLLSLLPAGGARVTDLARLSGMTKQAIGQFVTVLEAEGYVESHPHPTDKRVRFIRRTPKGDEVVETTNDLWARMEKRWSDQLGPRRWAAFRTVLIELAVGWDPDAASVSK